jgi:hypothetical protein
MSRLEPPEKIVNLYAAITHKVIDRIMIAMGDFDYEISPLRVADVSFYFMRDIYRLNDRQGGTITATKFAGYWAFWIRKVKPVLFAYDRSHSSYSTSKAAAEIAEINERLAFELAVSFLAGEGKGTDDSLHDQVRLECKKVCDGSTCLHSYTKKFFSHHGGRMQEYLIYSMAYRTFGPHHMTMILDQMIFGSCESYASRGP